MSGKSKTEALLEFYRQCQEVTVKPVEVEPVYPAASNTTNLIDNKESNREAK